MSESRSNQANQASQAGMAILIIVILFGLLFVGAGGLVWVRMRAQRAAAEDAMRMAEQALYQQEHARERADAATRMAEEALKAEQVQNEQAHAATVATDTAPAKANEPAPAEEGEVRTP
jgi:uncharacterized protein HemX